MYDMVTAAYGHFFLAFGAHFLQQIEANGTNQTEY